MCVQDEISKCYNKYRGDNMIMQFLGGVFTIALGVAALNESFVRPLVSGIRSKQYKLLAAFFNIWIGFVLSVLYILNQNANAASMTIGVVMLFSLCTIDFVLEYKDPESLMNTVEADAIQKRLNGK